MDILNPDVVCLSALLLPLLSFCIGEISQHSQLRCMMVTLTIVHTHIFVAVVRTHIFVAVVRTSIVHTLIFVAVVRTYDVL